MKINCLILSFTSIAQSGLNTRIDKHVYKYHMHGMIQTSLSNVFTMSLWRPKVILKIKHSLLRRNVETQINKINQYWLYLAWLTMHIPWTTLYLSNLHCIWNCVLKRVKSFSGVIVLHIFCLGILGILFLLHLTMNKIVKFCMKDSPRSKKSGKICRFNENKWRLNHLNFSSVFLLLV